MKFRYEAKKDVSSIVTGEIEAGSKDQAVDLLIEQNLYPISVDAINSLTLKNKQNLLLFKKRITQKDILTFTRNLLVFVKAKVELMQALAMLRDQVSKGTKLRELFSSFYDKTREGQSLSVTLAEYPEHFSPLYVNVISTGEVSGQLDEALRQISIYMQRKEEIKRKVSASLAYPAILLFVGLLSIYILINFVIPKLAPVLMNLGDDLPFVTKVILDMSNLSRDNVLFVALIFFTSIFCLYSNRKNKHIVALVVALKSKLPLINKLLLKQELANFTRALCMLLHSKVSILQAFEVAGGIISDPKLRKDMATVCKDVGSGKSLSDSLIEHTQLPDFFIKMVAVGEKSGRLNEVLEEVVISYEEDINGDIEMISSLLEPILILVLGSVLGIIVLSILIPMFQVTQTLG